MLVYLQCTIAIILCIISSFTDIKSKKIYNKILVIFVCLSSIIYIIFYNEIEYNFLLQFVNVLVSILISFLFYYYNIWAAGDAKLFIILSFIIPRSIYEANILNLFPSVILLVIIFIVAYLYVIIETIILYIKKIPKVEIKFEKNYSLYTKVYEYITIYFPIALVNNSIYRLIPEIAQYNKVLILIINMLLGIQISNMKSNKNFLLIISLILDTIYYCIFGFEITINNLLILLVIIITMEIKNASNKYNFTEINTNDIKEGMILSIQSSMLFLNSRVKGLPKISTETTSSRLTNNEVESIKRWQKTKKGKDKLIVVKYLPFAPFILVGTLVFIFFKVIM